MTNQHPIVPSPEQVDQWFDDAVRLNSTPEYQFKNKYYIATLAAQWGANQELEACLLLVGDGRRENLSQVIALRTARRPRSPGLKEQALKELRQLPIDPELGVCASALDTIRRALEALDDYPLPRHVR